MFIVDCTETEIVNANSVCSIHKNGNRIIGTLPTGTSSILGDYESRERMDEVFVSLIHALMDNDPVYIMPNEQESAK